MESNTTTTTSTQGIVFRCSCCKAHRRVDFSHTVVRTDRWLEGRHTTTRVHKWGAMQPVDVLRAFGAEFPRIACACGNRMTGRPIEGRVNPDVRCGAKCTHAKGHVCECSCGGENHGTGS